MPRRGAAAPPAPATVEALAAQLAAVIAALPLDEKILALNLARTALHEVSPFKAEPVDLVLWLPGEAVDANDYNPNTVAPPEMKLLELSIEADGVTQPIVTSASEDGDETVDGFHRGRVEKAPGKIRDRLHGHVPVARINASRAGRADRIAATIRHNRARGKHGVDSMSEIVRMLHVDGWPDEKIQAELGMQLDEVVRLKQVTGLAALFAERDFSSAWEPDDSRPQLQPGDRDERGA